ncbi:uncharacterized protein DDB_G0287625 [Lucilia cuprina]|uniref:uncharacterized protein DDB_G0287625 n=1 Tax=Lucilia cuprina TaxID=7375 RepID=UPI001F06A85C|nr:uncharacterized protein DDB_G0287625 [Lucilia cuprina]
MDNYGNEIGQKMRSAVKAKLVELGTGGSAGYIDDELPDYVMIMVANKRSKQQMISDLNLFLGNQTELFVTWLHEVLQKLQEVTLPAASASSKKRKSSIKEDSSSVPSTTAAKKDKKQAKKDKVSTSKKPKENTSSTTPEKTSTNKVVSSITDLVAGELLEKAKQTINATADATQNIKKSKHKRSSEELNNTSANSSETQKEFDIPTISEISSTTGTSTNTETTKETVVVSGNREKDLAELAEIQKKIYAAKKQLKQIGEFDDDDEDFLNLRDEDSREEFNENGDLVRKSSVTPTQYLQKHKEKSPIVFEGEKTKHRGNDDENDDDEELASKRKRFTPPPLNSAAASLNFDSSSKDDASEYRNEKRPVHQRLGMKNTSSSRDNARSAQPLARERRRNLQEKELYVPAFRRKEMERERERGQERSRERERNQHLVGDRGRERERERDRDRDTDRPRDADHNSNLTRGRPRVRRSFEERDKRRSTSENHNEERNSSQVGKISTTTPSTTNRARSSSKEEASPDISGTRKRIGSRVIVAPAKQVEMSDEEDLNDKPVNSVIKIKPRPPVSPSKQAPKNLLLRAVAEAQRSTILKKPSTTTKPKVALRLGDKINAQRNTKLYTKSYRNRLKTSTGVGALFTRTTKNIIVEVNGNAGSEKAKYTSTAVSYHNVGEDDEYIPESVSDRGESDQDYVYVPQAIHQQQGSEDELNDNMGDHTNDEEENQDNMQKTQFVVTLNEDKALPKLKRHNLKRYSRSLSPPPQVSSSSNNSKDREKYPEPTSTSNTSNTSRKSNIRERLSIKSSSSSNERRSSSSMRQEASTTPPPKRTELIEIYRKPKEIKKIIIKNDSEDDEHHSPSKKHSAEKERKLKRRSNESPPSTQSSHDRERKSVESRSTTPPLKDHYKERHKESLTPSKRKHVPIKFDLKEAKDSRNQRDSPVPNKKRRSSSHDNFSRDHSRDRERERERERDRDRDRERHSSHERREDKHKISIRNAEAKKYDNIPTSLNSVPVESSGSFRNNKPKERCKYHPNCTKSFCEFYHPTSACKSFPNCKFADKCLYSHPRCKYDLACVNLDCNFSHSGPRSASLLEPTAPPISSSVVPVQNYKSISSTAITGPVSSTTCKFFPNCTKTSCPFYHPKPCRYGKNCINKLECMFYHHEIPSSSKFKWIASAN